MELAATAPTVKTSGADGSYRTQPEPEDPCRRSSPPPVVALPPAAAPSTRRMGRTARGVTGRPSPMAQTRRVARTGSRRRGAQVLLAVAVGGALGTAVRYEVVLALPATTASFPWAIFAVNVAGAFILGVTMTLVLEGFPPTRYVRPFIGIGFCGGLTTFSTWMVDVTALGDAGHAGTAALDLATTLLVGLASLILGVWTARALIRERSRS